MAVGARAAAECLVCAFRCDWKEETTLMLGPSSSLICDRRREHENGKMQRLCVAMRLLNGWKLQLQAAHVRALLLLLPAHHAWGLFSVFWEEEEEG